MLENRIVRLEKQNRRLQILATAAIVAALLPWVSGSKATVIRAKDFHLVDSEGEVRGMWTISKDGKCKLIVSGKSEKGAPAPAAALVASADRASVQVEQDGHVQGMLFGDKDGATFATYQEGKILWARPSFSDALQETLTGLTNAGGKCSVHSDGTPISKPHGRATS